LRFVYNNEYGSMCCVSVLYNIETNTYAAPNNEVYNALHMCINIKS